MTPDAPASDAPVPNEPDDRTAGAATPATDVPPTEDPRPDGLRRADSLLLVNTGDGKGKSSAAFGMMIRAIARDWKVAVAQFVKNGEWKVGEETVGRRLGVDWFALGDGFTWDSDDLGHDRRLARAGWEQAAAIINAGQHHLVILDELTYLMTWGWIDTADVIATLTGRPSHVSVVVTGRDAPAELVEIADTVTEMRNVKHAYDRGIAAKRGLDY